MFFINYPPDMNFMFFNVQTHEAPGELPRRRLFIRRIFLYCLQSVQGSTLQALLPEHLPLLQVQLRTEYRTAIWRQQRQVQRNYLRQSYLPEQLRYVAVLKPLTSRMQARI